MKTGFISFEEKGAPWTAMHGRYELIRKFKDPAFGPEEHWEVRLKDGDITNVPVSSVSRIKKGKK